MQTETRKTLKRGVPLLLLGTWLSVAGITTAEAHGNGYRHYVAHRHYDYVKPVNFPRWLRSEREFQRWYVQNQYRLKRNLSWQRRYEVFYLEKSYRLKQRRFRGRVARDRGYRTYWNQPKRKW